jgi:hypothetical protein
MTQMQIFFGLENTQRQLSDFNRVLTRIPETDSDQFVQAKQLIQLIRIILANTHQFDECCQQNIKWIGNHFSSQLSNVKESAEDLRLDQFLSTFYRFVVEFDLSMKNELSMELRTFQQFVKENIEKFSLHEQEQVSFARQEMPIGILKALLNHDQIGSLKNVSGFSKEIDQKFIAWEATLDKHEKTVDKLQIALNEHETAFNFVGLHDGFNDMAIAKGKELNKLRGFMLLFGLLLVIPIAVELYFLYSSRDLFNTMQPLFVGLTALFSLSLTFLLIYFFRISVRSADSCKAQLLQVELRKTLCRFIQSYASYSKEIKEKNPESLSKFESLIFSGIVSNEERLPSTFDGVDQLANFVKALRTN